MSTTTSGGRPRDLGIDGYADFVRIGAGGYSTVYRARQELFDRDVAVKILSVQVVDDTARRRFRRECSAAGRISDHPYVATLLDAGFTSTGSPFITSEFCPGGSLADALRERGPFPVEEVLEVGHQLASGLQAVHDAGVLHRDIKPANILVSAYGEPMLSDFGIALAEVGVTATGVNVATPYYTAPEVISGVAPTIAGDVYSLAASLYELLTGRPPHAGGDLTLSQLLARIQTEPVAPIERPDVPDELRAVLARALSHDPAARQLSAAELASDLTTIADARAASTLPPAGSDPAPDASGAPAPALSRARRVPRVVVWVGAAVILLLALVGLRAIVSDDGTDTVIVVEEPDEESRSSTSSTRGEVLDPPERVDSFLAMLGDFRLGGQEIHASLDEVRDDSGFLTVRIPVAWDDVDTSGEDLPDGGLDGVVASPDLEVFREFGEVSGAELLKVPSVEPTPAALTDILGDLGLPASCASSGPVVVLNEATAGVAQAFQGCNPGDGVYVAFLVAGPDPSYSIFVGVMLESDADVALADQFFADITHALAPEPTD